MSKRSLCDSDDEAESSRHAKRHQGSSRREEFDADASAELQPNFDGILSPEELENLEKSFVPLVEKRRQKNVGRLGTVAECGIIERVELIQFMCHKYLTFDFGSQLNFIVGHNGSGKSAILAGIAVGLGGKAAGTGRGTGVRSLIQEGKNKAEITITLKNVGDGAYRPDLYGNKIFVVRAISANGSSAYKLKSAKGHVVSNRKADLDLICDALNIRVDNPISILTQDAAKTFLKGSSPELRYKFFMEGTYLQALRERYDSAGVQLDTITKTLEDKKDYGLVLKERHNAARTAFKDSLLAQDLRSKRTRLLQEHAWALRKTKEDELETAFERVASSEERVKQAETSLQDAHDSCKASGDKVEEMTADHEAVKSATQALWDGRKVVQDDLAAQKREMAKLKTDIRGIESTLDEANEEISRLTAHIYQESQELEVETQTRKEVARGELETMKEGLDALKAVRATLKSDLQGLKSKMAEAESRQRTIQADLEKLKRENEELTESYKGLKARIGDRADPLSQYGKNLHRVQDVIDKHQHEVGWHGQKPLGPLGEFVTLEREDAGYAEVLRQYLGHLLCAFAVTDARDIPPLKRILAAAGNPRARIVVSTGELFDFARGEPEDGGLLTVLRLLKISNEWVKRILIDQAAIEQLLLASSRSEAEKILIRLRGGDALAANGFKLKIWRSDGGRRVEAMHDLTPKDFRYSIFRHAKEEANELKEMAAKGVELRGRIQALENSESAQRDGMKATRDNISACEASLRTNGREIGAAEDNFKIRAEEDQADSPVAIAVLEQLKQEKHEQIASLQTQQADMVTLKKPLQTRIMELQLEIDEKKRAAETSEARRVVIAAQLEKEAVTYATARRREEHYQTAQKKEQDALKTLQDFANAKSQEFEELHEQASSLGEWTENIRAPAAVLKALQNLEGTLSRYEATHHKSHAQLEREVEAAKQAQIDFVFQWTELANLVQAMSGALQRRWMKWLYFRAYASTACKNEFMFHLSQRGYFGQAIFDHNEEKLELKIQSDDQAHDETQKKREADMKRKKDPASLSGGEKSLATLSFLLSLWSVCALPIRCLDEFDVFMDSQNRRCSISMLVDAAKGAQGRQTIIITPQSIDNVFADPPVVLIKQMTDPRA